MRLRAGHPRARHEVGPPLRADHGAAPELRRDRPAGGGAHHRPEAARPPRRGPWCFGAASSGGRRGRKRGPRNGRDHNPHGYTMFMAGGGVKGGYSYGRTDDYGYYAIENKVHIHDLHATILHLLGLDHERLTYRSQGRDFRLTDVGRRGRRGHTGLTKRPLFDENHFRSAPDLAPTVERRGGRGRTPGAGLSARRPSAGRPAGGRGHARHRPTARTSCSCSRTISAPTPFAPGATSGSTPRTSTGWPPRASASSATTCSARTAARCACRAGRWS